jgi:2-polyprenyl-6-methoxyphenol hydroxylase-like FAD-dependent oxidoreductase
VTGVLRIKNIEKRLSSKCYEWGVKRITGEFLSFDEGRRVLIKTLEGDIVIPYDVLIAADGFHSKTREALSIPMNEFGRAKGSYMIIPDFSIKKKGLYSEPIVKDGEEIVKRNKVFLSGTILNFQAPEEATGEQIRNFAMKQGWKKEVKGIDQGYAYSLQENIPVVLAQAQAFFSPERSALLVGDSAVSISFLFGDGVNVALACSELVGVFLEDFQENKKKAFETFNASMKIETDRILKRSSVLFEEKVSR